MIRKAAFIILSGIAVASHAGPGPVGQWLMETPASLFHIGLLQLQQDVARLNEDTDTEKRSVTAEYDLENNVIVIQASVHRLGEGKTEVLKQACDETIDAIRTHGGISPETGEYVGTYSTYAGLFEPRGYAREPEPKDWQLRLDQIISLRVAVISSATPTDIVQCEGPLVSNETTYRG